MMAISGTAGSAPIQWQVTAAWSGRTAQNTMSTVSGSSAGGGHIVITWQPMRCSCWASISPSGSFGWNTITRVLRRLRSRSGVER